MSGKRKKIIIFIGLIFAILILGNFAYAQQDANSLLFGGKQGDIGDILGLGSGDPRIIAASIIRVLLGFLGILALGLILYAGFLWMTSNGEAEKIEKAKKILIGAAIGLAIILSSFAIASYVLNSLYEATTGNGGDNNNGGGGNGGVVVKDFYSKSTSPTGGASNIPVNAKISFTFNAPADNNSIKDTNFVVKNSAGTEIKGDRNADRNRVVFSVNDPAAEFDCPANTCGAVRCLSSSDTITATVFGGAGGILSVGGLQLSCALGPCTVTFQTGNKVDCEKPKVDITNKQFCQINNNKLFASGSDDSEVSFVDFSIDGTQINDPSNPAIIAKNLFDTASDPVWPVNWDASAIPAGTSVTIGAEAYDLADNTSKDTQKTIVRAATCCNGVQDGDETGKDCGGICGACNGDNCNIGAVGVCTPDNSICASNFCNNVSCICQSMPVITSVSPNDGAESNFITIRGQNFGTKAGKVFFANNKEAIYPNIINPACDNNWRDDQIIAVVPAGAVDGPIKVQTFDSLEDATDDANGPDIDNFDVNNTKRPGLCLVKDDAGYFNDEFALEGAGFGAVKGDVKFGNNITSISANNIQGWMDTTAKADVPNLKEGRTSVFAAVNGENSNPLDFKVLVDATKMPVIDYIDPEKGPPGQYITIYGSNFKNYDQAKSKVTFKSDLSSNEYDANGLDFPKECSDSWWRDKYIIVKVPPGIKAQNDYANYKVTITNKDSLVSQPANFEVKNETPGPGLCKLDPYNGKAGLAVVAYGDNFNNAQGAGFLRFFNNQTAVITTWKNQSIDTKVPVGAQTGPVVVSNGNANLSNSLPFIVGDCAGDDQCSLGDQCCGAGTVWSGICRVNGTCNAGAATACEFEWTFSTASNAAIKTCRGFKSAEMCLAAESCPNSPGECQTSGSKVVGKGCGGDYCNTAYSQCNGGCSYDGALNICKSASTCDINKPLNLCKTVGCAEADKVNYTAECRKVGSNYIWQINTKGASCPVGSYLDASKWCTLGAKAGETESCNSCASGFSCSAGECVINNKICPANSTCTGSDCVDDSAGCECCCKTKQDCCLGLDCTPGGCGSGAPYGLCTGCFVDLNGDGILSLNLLSGLDTNFENDINNDGTADGWGKYDSKLSEGVQVENEVVDGGKFGDKAQRFKSGEIPSEGGGTYGGIAGGGVPALVTGNKYTLSFWAKKANKSPTCPPGNNCNTLIVSNQTGGGDQSNLSFISTVPITNEWKQYYVTANYGPRLPGDPYPNNVPSQLYIFAEWPQEEFFIDGIRLESGELTAYETEAEQDASDAACNCAGTSGKYCDLTNNPAGACLDQRLIGEECDGDTQSLSCQARDNMCGDGLTCDRNTCLCVQEVNECGSCNKNNSGLLCDPDQARCGDGLTCDPLDCTCKQLNLGGPGEQCIVEGNGACVVGASGCMDIHECLADASSADCRCCCTPGQTNEAGLECSKDKTPCSGANRGLFCGCVNDAQCGNPIVAGCSTDTCCRERPEVKSVYPLPQAEGICRNTVISATFNQKMNVASFSGNVIVLGDYGDKECPKGTQYLIGESLENKGFFARIISRTISLLKKILNPILPGARAQGANNYCAISGTVSGSQNLDDTTTLRFSPKGPLDPLRKYYVVVKGETGGSVLDSVKVGVESIYGVSMYSDIDLNITDTFNNIKYTGKIWYFTTMSDQGIDKGICKIDKVSISPSSYLFQTTENNQNENDADANSESFDTARDKDKVFIAKALAKGGQEITPIADVYDWNWSAWNNSNTSVVDFLPLFDGNINRRLVSARKEATEGKSKISVTVNPTGSSALLGESYTGEANVWLLICDNPWPAVDDQGNWTPWSDEAKGSCDINPTGVCEKFYQEFYYCRDAGGEGTADDLPAFLNDAVVRGSSTVDSLLKEYYFFHEKKPGATGMNLDIVNQTVANAGGEVKAAWAKVVGADGYKIYYGTQSGNYTNFIKIPGENITSAIINKGLNVGETYYFSATAYYKTGAESEYAPEIAVEIKDETPPNSPQGIALKNSCDGKASISWNANSDDAVGYRVYYGASNGAYGGSQDVKDATSIILTGLKNGNTYYVTVSAYDSFENESAKSLGLKVVVMDCGSLAARWSFDEGSGKTAYDSVGNNNGTLKAGAAFNGNGYLGAAVDFNGVAGSVVEIPHPSDGSLDFNNSDLTISFWAKYTDNNDQRNFISKSDGTSGYSFRAGSAPVFTLNGPSGNDYRTRTSSRNTNDGKWHFFTGVRDNKNDKIDIYVDGALSNGALGTNNTISINNTSNLNIGGTRNNSDYFIGSIDEINIYKKTLSAIEIDSLYKSYAKIDLNDGLVLWQSFDNGYISGSTAKDRSGKGYDGTIYGATLAPSKVGQALKFDGVNDYISIGDRPDLNFGTDDFSVSFWVNIPSSLAVDPRDIISKTLAKTSNVGYDIGTRVNSGALYSNFKGSGGIETNMPDAGINMRDDKWHNVIATFDRSGNITNYIDGIINNTNNVSGQSAYSLNNNAPFEIGRRGDTNDLYFKGVLDEVRIYNRLLSQADIKALYDQYDSSATILSSKIAEWKFEEGSGTTVKDSVGSADGQFLASQVSWSNDGLKGKAVYFNGTGGINFGKPSISNFGYKNVSISLWIKSENMTGAGQINPAIVSTGGGSGRIWIFIDPLGRNVYINSYFGSAQTDFYIGDNGVKQVDDNKWHNVIAVFEKNGYEKIYVDNVLVGQKDISSAASIPWTSVPYPGEALMLSSGFNGNYKGYVDEFVIYDKAFSANDVKELYNSYK